MWLSTRRPRQAQVTLSIWVRGESARFVWAPGITFRLPPSCFSQAAHSVTIMATACGGPSQSPDNQASQGLQIILILQTLLNSISMPGAPCQVAMPGGHARCLCQVPQSPIGRIGTMSSKSRHMLLSETSSPVGA